ncbi:LamG domain-containing protein, partial [Candidatus Nitrosotalea sp. FS]|uniref:LamG domain-containing protein n=1 Tax=Candidatus Nitrosotalea sp. FS TaxID=2341021 RepID=UPI0037445E36
MESNDSSSQNPSLSSNSTGSAPRLSFNQFSNATQVISNSTGSTPSLSFNQFSNATNTNDIVPIPSKSWNFTDAKTTIEQTLDNSTGLNLDGNKFLKENVASTQNLTALTLSAWVKPDYSQGSPQFTIISKENSFILGINNNIQPSKKAFFSVFDGIKWNTVTSNSTIPENWTHIVATYDGSSIGIYVNGTQESKIPLVGVSTISITGKIENQTTGLLSSNSDVVIGA